MVEQAPTVFISYSHDSPEHLERVAALADRLRQGGVDAILDRYELAPPEGWPHWMERQIKGADFVLLVCTETYRRRVDKMEAPGKGLGGSWEGHLITQHLYDAGAANERFIPVLFSPDDASNIPTPLRAATHYRVGDEEGYQNLYRRLTDQPRLARPELGPLRRLPAHEPRWQKRPPQRLVDVPPAPELFVGRERTLSEYKKILGVLPRDGDDVEIRRFTAIFGLPGVGKSTFVAALARDPDIQASFPDGIFWTAFGQASDLRSTLSSTLARWAAELGDQDATQAATLDDAVVRLRNALRGRRALLIIDDVWRGEDATPLQQAIDQDTSVLLTSRIPDVAELLVPARRNRYHLDVLSEGDALELLAALAPDVVRDHRQACLNMARDLQCLPLALHVAGRLLQAEATAVWGVEDLLVELRDGARVLREEAPRDMVPLASETIPTVAALLAKSTRVLDPELRDHFAVLGEFVPKPATFELRAMKALWLIDDPKPTAAELVKRGLLEPMGDGRFQMHALLIAHARSLLDG